MPGSDRPMLGSAAEAPYPERSVAWYATIVLALMYWLSILDRFIISLLVDPIKRDLGISDMQFGLLHGLAFSLSFTVFGLLAGTLADRFNRRRVIFVCVSVWSLATAACGMAQSFSHMLLARVGVGAGEAGLNPCATSMITDLFPRERLTSALAVYAIGASVGSGCAYLFGGLIVEMVSRTSTIVMPVIGEMRSWQAVFFIVGIPGALLSSIIFTVPEPVRRGRRLQQSQPGFWRGTFGGYGELFRFIRPRSRFFAFHYTDFAVASMIVTGSGAWYPAHMSRNFGWSPGEIGLIATTSGAPWVFLGGIAIFLALLSPLPACASAALNLVTPNELRGAGFALFASTSGLVGAGSGSLLIAAASDYLYGGGASIGLGIATVIAVSCPVAAVLLACGFRAMREAMAQAEIELPKK